MSSRHVRCVPPVLAAMLLASACGGGGTKAVSATPAPTPTDTRTLGVLGLGHSIMTAYASGADIERDAPENSWATGSNPAVNSVYQRLVAVEPANKDHVANMGVDGSGVDALPDEISAGLEQVPHPRLVLIMTIDGDEHCDGTDPANYPVYGAKLRAALRTLVEASPQVVIVILSQLDSAADGIPAQLKYPESLPKFEGTGMCDPFDEKGRIRPAAVRALDTIRIGYEQEGARVCAQFRQCHTDGGIGTRFTNFPAWSVPGDWNHLTVKGHARLAAMVWPTVARLLDVPAT